MPAEKSSKKVVDPLKNDPDLSQSDKDKEIEELKAQLVELQAKDEADKQARKFDPEKVDLPFDESEGENTILIHVLRDGFTALGTVWYKGQEIEFVVDSPAFKDTFDRNGWSWLSMRNNPSEQMQRWGEVRIGEGPWPGSGYEDKEAAEAENARRRRAPTIGGIMNSRRV